MLHFDIFLFTGAQAKGIKGIRFVGETILDHAIDAKRFSIFEVLIKAGAKIDQTGIPWGNKNTNLLAIRLPEKTPVLRLLIAAGAHFDKALLVVSISYSYFFLETSEEERVAVLTLLLTGGVGPRPGKLLSNVRYSQEHLHVTPDVPKSLCDYVEGSLYRLNLKDHCRLAIRKQMLRHCPEGNLIPGIRRLPLPRALRDFVAYGVLEQTLIQ